MSDFECKVKLSKIEIPKFKDCSMKVGWYEDLKYDDGTPVAEVAMTNEFGSGKIPPRPFMRPAEMKNKETWIKYGEQEIKRELEAGNNSIKPALDRLGLVIQGNIQEAISEVHEPALAEATIQNRLNTMVASPERTPAVLKPLVEPGVKGGILIGSVSHQVIEKG